MSAAWKALSGDQQRAGIAAAALFATLFLPWYGYRGETLTAFGVFTFVEAAVLVVAVAVLYLLYARSQRRGFHLPGGDGWAITIAGGWVVFLVIWRMFDKPDLPGAVGVEWGIFVTLGVGIVLAAAGQRLRVAGTPEPPNPAEDPLWETPPRRRRPRDRRPVDSAALTRVLRDERPSWDGEPPEPPDPSAPTRRLPPEDPQDPRRAQ